MDAPGSRNIPSLTSLRFFAALMVFVFHLDALHIRTFSGLGYRLQMVGYVGVSLFFVLSGFILVFVHADREMRPSVFYRERFARIYPAYFFSLFITAPGFFYVCLALKQLHIPFFAWFETHVLACALLVPTLLQSWVPQAALAWNAPAWSLSVEAFFYLLFPFLLPRLLRSRNQSLWRMAMACWLASVVISVGYHFLKPDGVAPVTDESLNLTWLNFLKFNPLVRLPEFVLGACCGVLFRRGWFNRRWASVNILGGLTVFAAAVVASPHIPYPILHDGVLAPALAAIILGLAMRPHWSNFLNFAPLVLLGNASYSLYLLHNFVLSVYFTPMGKLKPYGPLGTAIGYLLPILIAVVVYKFIEEPLRRKLRPKAQERPSRIEVLAQQAS